MTITSVFAKKLGYLSYMPPPTEVSTPTVSVSYSTGYVAAASWIVPDTPHTSVWVEWRINGGSWEPDASRPANTATASRAITGGQTVQVRVRLQNSALVYSAYSTSVSVLSPPEPVSGFAGSPVVGDVSLSWANPAPGTYNALVITRTGTGTTTTLNPNVNDTTRSDSPGSSFDVTYSIVANNAAGSSPARTIVVRTAPKPPTGATLVAVNPGILNFIWTAPLAQFNLSGYDIDLNSSSPISVSDTDSYQWTGAVHATSYVARVRTRDVFGQVSGWVSSAPVTGINDTTPPGCPTPSASWTQALPGFTVTYGAFTDLQGGPTPTLQISLNGGLTVSTTVNASPGGGTYAHTLPDSLRGTNISYRTTATDNLGNVGASPWVTFTAKPKGTFTLLTSQTATWKTAGTDAWRTDTQDVICGFYDYVNGIQYGFWLYGDDIFNLCKGYAPDSAKILLLRRGTRGYSGSITLHLHTLTSASGNGYNGIMPDDYVIVSPSMVGEDWTLDYTLPSGFLPKLGNGTAKGLGIRPNPDSQWAPEEVDPWTYRVLRGRNIDSNTGRLTIVFN